jgi:hypothetical protein
MIGGKVWGTESWGGVWWGRRNGRESSKKKYEAELGKVNVFVRFFFL